MTLILTLFISYLIINYGIKFLKKKSNFVFSISNKSSPLSVYFSLVASKINIQNFILISTIVALEGLKGLWFLLSAYIGHGVVVYVFYPLWSQLNYENENDLILDRYRTKWGRNLLHFRGLYVGLLVNVIIIAMSLLAMVDILEFFTQIDKVYLILILCLFNLINSWRSGIQDKIYSDGFNVVFFLFFLGLLIYSNVSEYGSWTALQENINNLDQGILEIFPETGTKAFSIFLVYVCIQWWSAQTFDGSGKTAQRIMGLKDRSKLVLIATHITEIVIFTLIAFVTLAGISNSKGFLNEVVFLSVLKTSGSHISLTLIVLSLLSIYFVAVEGQTNWAGSLINSSLKRFTTINLSRYAYIFLISFLVAPVSLYFGEVIRVLEFFLGISAGVAPVFVLRWFTPRINAQTQLAAMASAVILSILFDKLWEFELFDFISLSNPYPLKIIFVTTFVLLISFFFSIFTYKEEDRLSFIKFKSKLRYPKAFAFIITKAIIYGVFLCVLYIILIDLLLYL
jgi:Na+/proline symporter